MVTKLQRLLSNLSFAAICFAGFYIHVSQVVDTYFNFPSTNVLMMDVPRWSAIPALTVCWRYSELIDIERLRQMTSEKIPNIDFSSEANFVKFVQTVQRVVTIKDIFELTPLAKDILSFSSIRYPMNYSISWASGPTNTSRLVELSKFYVQEHMCYRLEVRASGKYDYYSTSRSIYYPGMAYQVGFNLSMFNKSELLTPTIHRARTLPTTSRLFSPNIRRFSLPRLEDFNFVHLSYSQITNKRLKSPYSTNCKNYAVDTKFANQDDCAARCTIERTVQQFGKFPFSHVVLENETMDTNRPHIQYNELRQNRTLEKQVIDVESTCARRCRQVDCDDTITLTETLSVEKYLDNLIFRVYLPRSANFYIAYQPVMEFFEFAIFVLSCLGTWLGISMLNLNPLTIFVKIKGGKKKAQRKLSRAADMLTVRAM